MIEDLKSLLTGRAASIRGSRPWESDVPLKADGRKISKREQKEIQICLNCTKKKCTGNCEKIRRNQE